MPEGLTQTKTPTFSETWPEIDRNGGRLQIGTVAGFTSENPAGINRNPHYTRAKADIAQHETLTQQVQTFRAKLKSSQDRLDRANATVGGLVPPDLPALTLAAQEAATAAHGAQERHSQIIANLTQQEATDKRCNEIKQDMEDGEKRYAVVGELTRLIRQSTPERLASVV
jgi:hypothetical protein